MSFSIPQQKAWELLTDLEKQALSLTVVSERSKQEAAIILNLAPYKFTEIFLRARKFFVMFTEYYEEYETLLPPDLDLSKTETLFISMVILKRRKPADLIKASPEFSSLIRHKNRQILWQDFMKRLQQHSDQAKRLYSMLVEFDKWNAYRILPKLFQEPSPFSRRRVKEFKKIKESVVNITDIGWELFLDMYGTTKPPWVFTPSMRNDNFQAEAVKLNKNALVYYTQNQLPVFSKDSQAKQLSELIFDYEALARKSPQSAQRFWANFRTVMLTAVNYNDLMNLKPGDLLDLHERDRKFIAKANEPTKSKTARVSVTPDGEFWK